MPSGKCFISSTIHDLADLRSFLSTELSSYGFEMLLSEQGTIPVDSSKHSYSLCLDAAKSCDYLIAIIDGRFGGVVPGSSKSITQMEIETAFNAEKKVFTFVRQSVWDAKEILRPYLKDKVKFRPSKVVEDARVFGVIDEIRKRPTGNWIFTFNAPPDILNHIARQIGFTLRTASHPDIDKLDQILAKRFLQEFNDNFMNRLTNGAQTEYILIDDAETLDDATSTFLPQTMRFAGKEIAPLFNDFMNKVVTLNNKLPEVFWNSRRDGFYTSQPPLHLYGTDIANKGEQVRELAVETMRSWRQFVNHIRGKWPNLILELHHPQI